MNTNEIYIPVWAVEQIQVIGHQCADGGKCHHGCQKSCFRKETCSPLSACTWLNLDWSQKEETD